MNLTELISQPKPKRQKMSAKITISEFTQAVFATAKKYWSEKKSKKKQLKEQEEAREHILENYREYLKGLPGRQLEKLEKNLKKEKTAIEEHGNGSDAKAQEWRSADDRLEAVLDEQSRRRGLRTGYDYRLAEKREKRHERIFVQFFLGAMLVVIIFMFFW